MLIQLAEDIRGYVYDVFVTRFDAWRGAIPASSPAGSSSASPSPVPSASTRR